MASALDLYKLLPKTNCGECGLPTCLAYAMRLAQKSIKASDCPYITNDVKIKLEDSSLPLIKEIIIVGKDQKRLIIGGETTFYRHEKKFNNQTILCIAISDQDSLVNINRKLHEQAIERLAERLATNMIALINDSKQKEPFIQLIKYVQKSNTFTPLCLLSENAATLNEALSLFEDVKPIFGYVTEKNKTELFALARKHQAIMIISSNGGVSGLATLAREGERNGITNIILDCTGKNAIETLQNQTFIRWKVINEKNRSLGYPIISIPAKFVKKNFIKEILLAGLFLIKYSSIVVLQDNLLNYLVPLLVLRQNIYTDPQKPIQVTPGVYPIGAVNKYSPVFLTTNFSLTYFTVCTDIESSGIPSYLIVIDTEGTSVLTAFAAGKITPEKIAQTVEETGLAAKVTHQTLIIPGYLSPLSSKIEDATKWKILVGPADSSEIPLYLEKIGGKGK